MVKPYYHEQLVPKPKKKRVKHFPLWRTIMEMLLFLGGCVGIGWMIVTDSHSPSLMLFFATMLVGPIILYGEHDQ